jgi:hypothetical protein
MLGEFFHPLQRIRRSMLLAHVPSGGKIVLELLWCAFHPEVGIPGLPEGWFAGRHSGVSTFSLPHLAQPNADQYSARLERLFAGKPEDFAQWVEQRTAAWTHPFDLAIRDADFETLHEFWGF